MRNFFKMPCPNLMGKIKRKTLQYIIFIFLWKKLFWANMHTSYKQMQLTKKKDNEHTRTQKTDMNIKLILYSQEQIVCLL